MAKLTKSRAKRPLADNKLILSHSPGLSDDFPASFRLMIQAPDYTGKLEKATFYHLNMSTNEARRLQAWLTEKLGSVAL